MPASATLLPLSSTPAINPQSTSATSSRSSWCFGGDGAQLGLCPSLAVAASAAGASTSAPLDALGRAANWAEEVSSLSASLVNVIAAIGLCSLASHIYARWKEREEKLKAKRRRICRALEAWLDRELERRKLEACLVRASTISDTPLEDHLPELAGCLKAVLCHDREAVRMHRSIFGRGGGGRTSARVALLLLWHQISIADPDAPVELHARLVDEALVRVERRGSLTDSRDPRDASPQGHIAPSGAETEDASREEDSALVAEDDVRALAQLLRRPLPTLAELRLWPAEERVARLVWPQKVPTAEELVERQRQAVSTPERRSRTMK